MNKPQIIQICNNLIDEFQKLVDTRETQIKELLDEIDDIKKSRIEPCLQIMNLLEDKTVEPTQNYDTITQEQYDLLMDTFDEYPETVREAQIAYKVNTLRDLPANKYKDAIKKMKRHAYGR